MEYVSTWRKRCYSNDIPDEVPRKVMQSGRAPSYKAIALAILKNDLHFYSLGFSRPLWDDTLAVVEMGRIANNLPPLQPQQLDLFEAPSKGRLT